MSDLRRPSDRAAEVAALFDGARLRLARHLAGIRKSELAALIDKSATAVAAWESGAKHPTAATVAQLALGLSVEPGFFAVRPDDIAALSSTPHFRSLRSTSQLARDQAFAYGQLAVDIGSSLERHVEFPDPDLPSLLVPADDRNGDGPERAAQLVRSEWRIEAGPVGHLVRLLENHGVLVIFSPSQAASVDAYSFASRLRPVVVLNPIKRDYYRQRFDVAHELGHLVIHGDAEPGGRIVEEQAHLFASELLMPAAEIRDLLPATMGGNAWVTLAKLKEQWGVSIQSLLFRARRLGRLGDISYRNAMTSISARGWRRDEPGLITAIEQPSLLPRAVELLNQEGVDETVLVAQCRVPADLFRIVTSRTPRDLVSELEPSERPTSGAATRVVSLLERRRPTPSITGLYSSKFARRNVMYEIDLLKVGAEEKSGDAIALRFSYGQRWVVVIVDGGFTDVGFELVDHVKDWYNTSHVDLVISTHPDADHINGLTPVLENLDVDELFIHLPSQHRADVSSWGMEATNDLVRVARRRGVTITEPFTGTSRFGGAVTIAGPTAEYYESLLDSVRLGSVQAAAASRGFAAAVGVAVRKLARIAVDHLPFETLTDLGETSERNNSSVITLLTIDGRRLLLTGDAGIPALTNAAEYLETLSSSNSPLALVQVPHHGSRHNVGPTILNRLLGLETNLIRGEAIISASDKAPKHPSPKVANSFLRRGYPAHTTEEAGVCFPSGVAIRPGWSPSTPLSARDESAEEDD